MLLFCKSINCFWPFASLCVHCLDMGTYLAVPGYGLCRLLLDGACQLHFYQHREPGGIIKAARKISKKQSKKSSPFLMYLIIALFLLSSSLLCFFLLSFLPPFSPPPPPLPFFLFSEVSQLTVGFTLINRLLKVLNKSL